MKQIEKPSFKKVVFRVIIMVVYLLIGGAIFQVFEKPYQLMKNEEYRHTIQLFRKRYNVSERDMNILEQRILQDGKYFLSVDWSFSEAFFFAGTTVLTVGYGNVVPRTTDGRLFCIVYALLGIPIACLALKSIADRITGMQISLIKKTWKYFGRHEQVPSIHFKASILNGVLTVLAIMLLAALANLKRTEWTYFECIYFSFITFTTIGFGDYVPTYGESFDEYDAFTLVLGFLIGFTLVSCLLCSVSNAIEEHSRTVMRRAKSTMEQQKIRSRLHNVELSRMARLSWPSISGVNRMEEGRGHGVTLQKYSINQEQFPQLTITNAES